MTRRQEVPPASGSNPSRHHANPPFHAIHPPPPPSPVVKQTPALHQNNVRLRTDLRAPVPEGRMGCVVPLLQT